MVLCLAQPTDVRMSAIGPKRTCRSRKNCTSWKSCIRFFSSMTTCVPSPRRSMAITARTMVTRIVGATTMTDITNGEEMVEPSSDVIHSAGKNCITRLDAAAGARRGIQSKTASASHIVDIDRAHGARNCRRCCSDRRAKNRVQGDTHTAEPRMGL
jgi:hypothetical protein